MGETHWHSQDKYVFNNTRGRIFIVKHLFYTRHRAEFCKAKSIISYTKRIAQYTIPKMALWHKNYFELRAIEKQLFPYLPKKLIFRDNARSLSPEEGICITNFISFSIYLPSHILPAIEVQSPFPFFSSLLYKIILWVCFFLRWYISSNSNHFLDLLINECSHAGC